MTTELDNWKEEYDRSAKEAVKRYEEMTPEPLYESHLDGEDHLCLVCGKQPAQSALRTPSRSEPIVPLCKSCSADWNCYGYAILKKIQPAALVLKVGKWFVLHPIKRGVVWTDLRQLMRWQKKMANMRKAAKKQKG